MFTCGHERCLHNTTEWIIGDSKGYYSNEVPVVLIILTVVLSENNLFRDIYDYT